MASFRVQQKQDRASHRADPPNKQGCAASGRFVIAFDGSPRSLNGLPKPFAMPASDAQRLGPIGFCTGFPYKCSRSTKQVFPEEIHLNTLYYKEKKDILSSVKIM
jgi:hypothetical protein